MGVGKTMPNRNDADFLPRLDLAKRPLFDIIMTDPKDYANRSCGGDVTEWFLLRHWNNVSSAGAGSRG